MVESSFATVGAFLKQRVTAAETDTAVYEYGEVQSFSDNIVQIKGLSKCRYGELLEFDGGAVGLTMDLHLGGVGAALLGGKVSTSSVVRPTGRVAEVKVGPELLGRVADLISERATRKVERELRHAGVAV
jgi:F-type H+-transporting ATPase subunit alpha